MKRFVLAIALTGLMSVPVLAGNIPTNGVVETPPPPPATTSQSATMSTTLANFVLTILTLIGR